MHSSPCLILKYFCHWRRNHLFTSSYSSLLQTLPPISYQSNFLLQVSHSGCLIEIKPANRELSHSSVILLLSLSLMSVMFIHVIGCSSTLPLFRARYLTIVLTQHPLFTHSSSSSYLGFLPFLYYKCCAYSGASGCIIV